MTSAVAPAKRHHFFGRQCNALCTRGTLHDLTTIALPQPPGLEPRNAIVARVVLPGLEVTVAVTHLHHRPRSNARPQLELVLETLATRPGPHLLLGDLNLAAEEAVPLLEGAGYTPAEVLGRNPRLLKSGETPAAEYRRLWETIASGGDWRGEFHNKRKDGTLYWVSASISPVREWPTTMPGR